MARVWLAIKRRHAGGFSPVEVLLAATIFGFLVTALMGAIIYGRGSTASSGERARAVQLAEEGTEAVRNIRDANYANLVDGTYGLVQSGNQWILSGTSDVTGIFTRQITIAPVDSSRKTITANVTWPQGNSTAQVNAVSRLTNWLAAIIPPASWSNAVLAGSLDSAGTNDGLKVATAGNYAYVVRNDGTPDFLVVNISNPAAPTLAGSLSLTGAPTNIAISGNYAYVTSNDTAGELKIINITNPAAPSLAGTYNATGTNAAGLGVFVIGTTAYMTRASSTTTNSFEFNIINAVNPASPTLVGGYNNNIAMNRVWVSGNYAYIATSSTTQELMVVNITTPSAPTLAGSLDLAGTATAMAIDGYSTNRLLVGQGTSLRAINITTPTAPALLGSVTPTGTGTINSIDIEGTNTYAFIGTNATAAEFQVVDITNPAAMSIARVVDLTGAASTLNGVAWNSSLDIVVGAVASNTQEVVTFRKN